ncbi:hypothetical protein I7I52_01261 [Histoplasma capsulatum]|uniref:Secreted protein n=1 Tax=Ajellomyces capsulatus TaxID=5037 RepID=A0A8H8D6C2_AJECA|nr:hypothetical protein I7I52_01261 [Histoplasma capsulatum]
MTFGFFFFFFFPKRARQMCMIFNYPPSPLRTGTRTRQNPTEVNRIMDQKNARTPKSCQPCAGAQSMAVDGGLPITGCRLCFPAPCDVGSRANFPSHDVLFDETNSCVKSR